MLYLASQSPRRQQILRELGVQFDLLLPDASEDTELLEQQLPHEKALDYVVRVTLAKLSAANSRLLSKALPFAPILCADTTVALTIADKDVILGKPIDDQDAIHILELLSGKKHQVHTAIALLTDPKKDPLVKVSSTEVLFAPLTKGMIAKYVETSEPMGKAGAYGIQGIGSCLIEKIDGSYSGVMGLPIFETRQLLEMASIPFILSL
jgi:septum formation protein